MRYIKALLIIAVFFFCLIFLFQNQTVLSQKLILEYDLLVVPPMHSIELPFYMLLLFGFLVGALMAFMFLVWDRVRITARAMSAEWKVANLEKSERKLLTQMEQMIAAPQEERPGMFAKIKADFLKVMSERKKKELQSPKEEDAQALKERKKKIQELREEALKAKGKK